MDFVFGEAGGEGGVGEVVGKMGLAALAGTASADKYMDVKIFLEDLFAREVDLVTEQAIKPRLKPRILSEVEYVPGL
jgi:hypothetical protein